MNGTPPLITAPPATRPRRTGWIVYAVVASFLLALSILGNFTLMALVVGRDDGAAMGTSSPYNLQEQFVTGNEDARDKIVEIELSGVIGFSGDDGGHSEGMVGQVKEQLEQASRDKHVKAILLRINSPGGEVVASDALYQALVDVRENNERDIKIVACIETVGASGAFYAAMGTDYIVANEMGITASIGVIMQTVNFGPHDDPNSLMHKLGVKSYTFKSGKLKDILNPTRTPTEEESALVQNLVMEVYEKFVGIVASERDLDVELLKSTVADGRIVSGKQAFQAKLIDEVGYYEDAVEAAKELAQLKDAKVVQYVRPFSLRNLFRLFTQTETAKIQVQLVPNPLKLKAGQLYFLPAYMFQ